MASRLHRLIRILRILRRKSYPGVQTLCQTLQVKERTIFNDLKELKEELGVDVQFDKARRGYYLASDDLELGFTSLTEESAFLLIIACRLLAAHGGEELAAPLEELFSEEIQRCLGLSIEEIKGLVSIRTQSPSTKLDPQMIVKICRACLRSDRLQLKIHYGDKGGLPEKLQLSQLIPINIVVSPEEWSLVVHNGDEKVIEEIQLGKISGCESQSE